MKERPILFLAPMVRAILEGRKTQTRRVVKPQPVLNLDSADVLQIGSPESKRLGYYSGNRPYRWSEKERAPVHTPCPYGAPGDRLWVRETWGYRVGCGVNPTTEAVIEYRADSTKATLPVPAGESGLPKQRPNMTDAELLAWWESWRPSIHMPRWASRITLEVTGVSVERLQDISAGDCIAEGIEPAHTGDANEESSLVRAAYATLWESINGAGSWAANPWVWVVAFRRIEQEARAA